MSDPNLSTDDLVNALIQGTEGHYGLSREEAFSILYTEIRPRIFAFLERKGVPFEEKEDLAQDILIRVLSSLSTFRSDYGSFLWWVIRVSDNILKNHIRYKRAEKRDGIEYSLDALDTLDDAPRPKLELVFAAPSPLADIEIREHLAQIRSALQQLPPQMRQCCLLRYEKSLKYNEIAIVMNISIETVKAHLFQAKKRLTALLGDKSAY